MAYIWIQAWKLISSPVNCPANSNRESAVNNFASIIQVVDIAEISHYPFLEIEEHINRRLVVDSSWLGLLLYFFDQVHIARLLTLMYPTK